MARFNLWIDLEGVKKTAKHLLKTTLSLYKIQTRNLPNNGPEHYLYTALLVVMTVIKNVFYIPPSILVSWNSKFFPQTFLCFNLTNSYVFSRSA